MAWAWSATYSQRMSLLASAQIFYSGRQVGGKIAAGSKVGEYSLRGPPSLGASAQGPGSAQNLTQPQTYLSDPHAPPSMYRDVCACCAAEKTKAGAQLMPTEPDLLEDARNWVKKWPDAVGHTSLLSSFLMADEHWNADCWWVLPCAAPCLPPHPPCSAAPSVSCGHAGVLITTQACSIL